MEICPVVVAVVLLLVALGCPGSPSPSPSSYGSGANASVLYANNCAACHGTNSVGKSAIALNNPEFINLHDDSYFRDIIAKGIPNRGMPAFAQEQGGPLSGADINSLVTYLKNGLK